MNLKEMIIPAPAKVSERHGIVCQLSKLNWIESDGDFSFAAGVINEALEHVGMKRLPYKPWLMNLGTRQRISLRVEPSLAAESYVLSVGDETVTIAGGDTAGVLHGARSLAQVIAVASDLGGHERFIPVGTVEDSPRFQYRGVMLDSSRHFQHAETIVALLDEMSKLKLNRFHWHMVDRQGWRLPLECAPELVRDMPKSRCYNFGSYTLSDIEAVKTAAKERNIIIIPEIEMPGHSAAVFMTHPELACDNGTDPFADDFWEFCIGNPETKKFLSKILKETCSIFPDSPVIHIGGDEASTRHWEKCPKCQAAMRKKGFTSLRQLERDFMREMEDVVRSFGREAMIWGATSDFSENFSDGITVQNWLRNDISGYAEVNRKIINSFHRDMYIDYPVGDDDPVETWQKKTYEFDAAAGLGKKRGEIVLGGEGCIWTEQIPEWRTLPRAIPRIRALAESLWTPPALKKFSDFQLRERRLIGSGLM